LFFLAKTINIRIVIPDLFGDLKPLMFTRGLAAGGTNEYHAIHSMCS
jgi:hypothetical protein